MKGYDCYSPYYEMRDFKFFAGGGLKGIPEGEEVEILNRILLRLSFWLQAANTILKKKWTIPQVGLGVGGVEVEVWTVVKQCLETFFEVIFRLRKHLILRDTVACLTVINQRL